MADDDRQASLADSCLRILEAGADGTERVHGVLVRAARALTRADGAVVAGWRRPGPQVLAASGPVPELPARRLPQGLSAAGGRTFASVVVAGAVDLLVWWTPGSPSGAPAAADRLEELRLLAAVADAASRRATDAVASLYAAARGLLAAGDPEEALLGLATTAAEVLRAEVAGIFLATSDGEHVEARAVVGNRSVGTARLRLAKGESMVGHVFATGEVYRSADWATDPVVSPQLLPLGSTEGSQACIGAPIRVGETCAGVLAAWRRRRSLFSAADVELIQTLADLAALGVARADADERLRRLSAQLVEVNAELSRNYAEASETLAIHQRLIGVLAGGADLQTVVDTLQAITGQQVRFAGIEGSAVGSGLTAGSGLSAARPAGGSADWLAELMAAERKESDEASVLGAGAVLLGPDDAGRHAIAAPVRSAGLTWGELAVASTLPAATRDIVATEQGAIACALLLSRQDAVATASRRLESEFVWDLLDGRVAEGTDALVRSRQLGRELPATARVVLLHAAPRARRGASSPERIENARTALLRHAAGLVTTGRARPAMGWRGETLAIIVPEEPAAAAAVARMRRLGEELARPGDELDRTVSVGVSAPVRSLTEYPVAGRQARYALSAARPPKAPVAVFEELGAVQFLLEPATGEDLDRFVEQQLGALLTYDRDHDANLVATLAAYLRCDGHVQRAAEAMCIHPKTMSYRLGRIEALSGIAVGSQTDRFHAQLALQILAIRTGHPEL